MISLIQNSQNTSVKFEVKEYGRNENVSSQGYDVYFSDNVPMRHFDFRFNTACVKRIERFHI